MCVRVCVVYMCVCVCPTSPPSCNGYLEYSGVQVHLTLSYASTMVQVGLRVPTPFAERRSQASLAPGVCSALALETCLVHRQPGFARCAWPPSGSNRIYIFAFVYVPFIFIWWNIKEGPGSSKSCIHDIEFHVYT